LADFERQAKAESVKAFNADLQLVFFDLNRTHDAGAALTVATKMSAERHDCGTLDALAWALYSNGKYGEAKTQMDRALAVGIRDPLFFCHASQIAAKSGDAAAVSNYQRELATFKGASCAMDQSEAVMGIADGQAR